jgi:hypothetical protein
VRPRLAELGRRERARDGAARDGAPRVGAAHVRYGSDLTGARVAAGESTAGPHRRMDGSAAELVGVDGGAQAARRFSGDLQGTTMKRVGGVRDEARTRRHDVLTGASDGVDGGMASTAAWCAQTRTVGSGQRWSVARVVRRSAAALSERGTETAQSGGGCQDAGPRSRQCL